MLLGSVLTIGAPACATVKVIPAPPGADAEPAEGGVPNDTAFPEPEPEPEPPALCSAENQIDSTKFPYKPPRVVANACTPSELDALVTFFRSMAIPGEDVPVAEWSAEVSVGCAQCVFGDGSGATWPPIVTRGDRIDFVNRGGCIELASGSDVCGRSYQQAEACRVTAYRECSGEPGVGESRCSYARSERDAVCPSLAEHESTCASTQFTFEAPIRAQCITGN
ncbi:MAG: hypothetical protein KF894_03140 [Labilithrix sp.]|nr:hypothetical protein [Labilithrix sp.]